MSSVSPRLITSDSGKSRVESTDNDAEELDVHSLKPSGGISIDDKITTVTSGEAVEVLSREDGYAKIRHKEVEGWVEESMLTKERVISELSSSQFVNESVIVSS